MKYLMKQGWGGGLRNDLLFDNIVPCEQCTPDFVPLLLAGCPSSRKNWTSGLQRDTP